MIVVLLKHLKLNESIWKSKNLSEDSVLSHLPTIYLDNCFALCTYLQSCCFSQDQENDEAILDLFPQLKIENAEKVLSNISVPHNRDF